MLQKPQIFGKHESILKPIVISHFSFSFTLFLCDEMVTGLLDYFSGAVFTSFEIFLSDS